MADTKINGMKTKPIPASVKAAIQKGYPKRTAMSTGKTTGPKVRV